MAAGVVWCVCPVGCADMYRLTRVFSVVHAKQNQIKRTLRLLRQVFQTKCSKSGDMKSFKAYEIKYIASDINFNETHDVL